MSKVNPRLISLEIDGVDRSDEVSKFVTTSAPTSADWQSFADARAGGKRDYAAVMTIAQDHAAGTLWTLIYEEPGSTAVITYAPYGNEVATALQPHYQRNATVKEPDGDLMGGEADPSPTAVASIEVTWPFEGKPTKITA